MNASFGCGDLWLDGLAARFVVDKQYPWRISTECVIYLVPIQVLGAGQIRPGIPELVLRRGFNE